VFRSFGVAGILVTGGIPVLECVFANVAMITGWVGGGGRVDLAARMEKHRRCLISPLRGDPPMLPELTLPASFAALLGALRPCFTARSFRTFCGLAAGLAGQVRRRTVAGMLLGAGLARAWPHDRAHYFFARARWEAAEWAWPPPGGWCCC
jgi:hypothetical protein